MARQESQRARKARERLECVERLREDFSSPDIRRDRDGKPVVYTILRHVSRSGMLRHLDLFMIHNGEPVMITHRVALALDWSVTDRGYLKVTGCGMDMGFHVVYSLARTVMTLPEGSRGDRGYLLSQRWL